MKTNEQLLNEVMTEYSGTATRDSLDMVSMKVAELYLATYLQENKLYTEKQLESAFNAGTWHDDNSSLHLDTNFDAFMRKLDSLSNNGKV